MHRGCQLCRPHSCQLCRPPHPAPTPPHSPTPPPGTVLAAFQPSVPLAALSGWFGFAKKKEAAAFLREKGAVVVDGCLDIKASRANAAALAAEAAAAAAQDARR